MCVAIYKPASAKLSKSDLAMAFTDNNDGAGWAWREDGAVRIHKAVYKSFDAFWKAYRGFQHLELLLHFRAASIGHVTLDNAHPHPIAHGGALIHNGHFSNYGTREISDTRHWIADVLNPLLTEYPNALESRAVRQLLSQGLGGSKIAIMTPDDIFIMGGGHWEQETWYSQTHYRQSAIGYARTTWAEYYQTTTYDDDTPQDTHCAACEIHKGTELVCLNCLDDYQSLQWRYDTDGGVI